LNSYKNKKVLVGANTGLYLYNPNKKVDDHKIKTQIAKTLLLQITSGEKNSIE